MSKQDRRWNHNTHYYPLVLAAVPDGCRRALDVGCGEGMLARELAARVPQVVGIDKHEPSIALAREQGPDGRVEYVLGDFLEYPFPAASFTCVRAGRISTRSLRSLLDPSNRRITRYSSQPRQNRNTALSSAAARANPVATAPTTGAPAR